MARVLELNCYPVKGCAATPLTHAAVASAGLAHDRRFMVTGEDGAFRSQRRDPRLGLISPAVRADGARLTLAAEGFGSVSADIDMTSTRRGVELFGVPYAGIDQGDAAAAWLSEVLGKASRLVRVPPEHHRVVGGETPGTSGYADSAAVHLTTETSLAELNRRIAANGRQPVSMSRFRANVVVDGWDAPNDEDSVRRMIIGDTELAFSKLAIRCAVALVDQNTPSKAGPEPLRTLAAYRRGASGGVAFGVKLAVLRPGKLSVGDELNVIGWDQSPRR